MSDLTNKFKYAFTPSIIFEIPGISWLDKFVLSIINSLEQQKGCTASNEYFAGCLKCDHTQVSRSIAKMEKAGIIKVKKKGPRMKQDRLISIDKMTIRSLTKCQNVIDKLSNSNLQNANTVIDKTPNNNIVNNNKVNSKVDSEEKPTQKNTNPNISLNDEKDSKKKKSEAAKKEKEPQFGGGRPMTFIYFDIMKDKRPNMFPEKPMEGHLIDLKRIIKSVEAFIRDQKQKAGLPAFNVSKQDLEDNFRVFVDNLPKRILDKHFSTASIARNIHGYLYEMHAGKLKDNSKGTHDELLAMKEAIRQKRELRKQNHKL